MEIKRLSTLMRKLTDSNKSLLVELLGLSEETVKSIIKNDNLIIIFYFVLISIL